MKTTIAYTRKTFNVFLFCLLLYGIVVSGALYCSTFVSFFLRQEMSTSLLLYGKYAIIICSVFLLFACLLKISLLFRDLFFLGVFGGSILYFSNGNALTAFLLSCSALFLSVRTSLYTARILYSLFDKEKNFLSFNPSLQAPFLTVLTLVLTFYLNFSVAFLLLAFGIFYKKIFFVTLLFLLCIAYCIAQKKNLLSGSQQHILVNRLKFFSEGSFVEWFLFLVISSSLLFTLFITTYPLELSGDAQKAYSAFSKFYALFNKLVITSPAQTTEPLLAFGFPHAQEIFLSVGYLIGENVGQKIFAVAIILGKLLLFCITAHSLFLFSRAFTLFAAAVFLLLPMVSELQCCVRPENLLTLILLGALFFGELFIKAPQSLFLFFSQVFFLPSVKYTGIQLAASLLFPYLNSSFTLIRSKSNYLFRSLLFTSPFLFVSLYWYIRNYFNWGFIFKVYPWDQNWVASWYPALITVEEWHQFFISGFVTTDTYTEFVDLGYGFFGVIFFAGAVWGMLAPSITAQNKWIQHSSLSPENGFFLRRVSILCFTYIVCMSLSTRQIRYLAPIIPLLLLLSLSMLRWIAHYFDSYFAYAIITTNKHIRYGVTLCSLLLFFPITGALTFTTLSVTELGQNIKSRLPYGLQDLSLPIEPFKTLNRSITSNDLLLASHIDNNYSLNGNIMRADYITDVLTLKTLQERYSYTYWLNHTATDGIFYNFFFNDLGFLNVFGSETAKAFAEDNPHWGFHLFRPRNDILLKLYRYAYENGWDLSTTVLISKQILEKNEFSFVATSPVIFPFDTTQTELYKVLAYWDPNKMDLHILEKDLARQNAFSPAWFFDKAVQINHTALYYYQAPLILPFQKNYKMSVQEAAPLQANNANVNTLLFNSVPIIRGVGTDAPPLKNYTIIHDRSSVTYPRTLSLFIKGITSDPSCIAEATISTNTGKSTHALKSTTINLWKNVVTVPIENSDPVTLTIRISTPDPTLLECGLNDVRFMSYSTSTLKPQ
jgi:hypothetical protein